MASLTVSGADTISAPYDNRLLLKGSKAYNYIILEQLILALTLALRVHPMVLLTKPMSCYW
jgi:hypothetical protein